MRARWTSPIGRAWCGVSGPGFMILVFRVSSFVIRVSVFVFRVPFFVFRVSISGLWFRISCFVSLVPYFVFQVSCFVSRIWSFRFRDSSCVAHNSCFVFHGSGYVEYLDAGDDGVECLEVHVAAHKVVRQQHLLSGFGFTF